MEHVAIDLGGRESQICVRSADGEIVEECRWATRRLSRFLRARASSRVIVETCSEAFAVADQALELGHEVRVVPATLVRSLGVGSRRVKTDQRDAQILSEVSTRIDLPSVHIPSHVSRERKTMCGMRERLIDSRTQLVNCVRGWLRGQTLQLRKGTTRTFARRVRSLGRETPDHVERLLTVIEELTEQIRAADKELKQIVESDALLRRLTTCPGVGPVTAMRFTAAIDDVTRFGGAHQLESYLGLTPGEKQSSDKRHRLGITKAGPAAVRRTLVQAAWATRRLRTAHPIVEWSLGVEKRRGRFIAILATARKLAGILFAMWRDGTSYDKARGARAAT